MELTIDQALQQGVAAHKEGKLQEAELLYQAILQVLPKHADANHNLGILAVAANKNEAALPLFKKALETNPKIEQFWVSYINALIKEEQFENVEEMLEKGQKAGLTREKADALEAKFQQIGQPTLSKLSEESKSFSLKERRKNNSESKQQKKKRGKSITVNNVSPSRQQLSSLLECYQSGRYVDAESLAMSIIKKFPEHQFGWKVLGAIFEQTNRKSEALNANQRSVKLAPQDAEAHNNLGNTHKELGRLVEAEASLRQADSI